MQVEMMMGAAVLAANDSEADTPLPGDPDGASINDTPMSDPEDAGLSDEDIDISALDVGMARQTHVGGTSGEKDDGKVQKGDVEARATSLAAMSRSDMIWKTQQEENSNS